MVTQTETFDDEVEDETVTTEVSVGNRTTEVEIQTVTDRVVTEDDRVPVSGKIGRVPFRGTLRQVVDTDDSENKYALEFNESVGMSGTVGDVVMSSVSKVWVPERTGDRIFTSYGKRVAGDVEEDKRKESMIYAARAFAENDEDFRQKMLSELESLDE